jgi:hypothetical protein
MKLGSILASAVRRGVPAWAPFLLNQRLQWSGAPTEGRPYKLKLSILICVMSAFSLANAQEGGLQYSSLTGHCEGEIYNSKAIPSDHKARIRNRTVPSMTQPALSDGTHGTVVIEAVLCRNGQVTDLEVLEGLPNGLTEESIRSVLGIEFTPAEINLHSVSQKIRFEFSFNDHKSGVISPREAEGKSIRSIEVVGNRRLQDSEIIRLLKTEPGNQFSAEYAKQDLASLLSTGYFNPRGTSVTTEVGPDGDVTVIFEVQEMPLISEVRFEGLEKVTSSQILSALQNENIQLGPGAVYDLGKVKTVTGIIERVLEKGGQKAARVELRTEQTSFDRVSLTFVISHQ